MSGSLVEVRFKLAWQHYRVGDVIKPHGMQRDWLIANGYVELVKPMADRPAKLAGKAAKKIADATKGIFG